MISSSRPIPPPVQYDIKPGMIVRLKSGSPIMTVDQIIDGIAYCVYFIGTQPQRFNATPNTFIEINEKEIYNARPSDTD